jgi:3-phytase
MKQPARLSPPIPALILLATAHWAAAGPVSVTAALETRPHFDDTYGNFTDVDDPAIWIHPQDPGASLVAGTLKYGGLDLYTLDGKLLQHVPARLAPGCGNEPADCDNASGRLNNAEIVYGYSVQGKDTDLVVASDRGLDSLAIFALRPNSDGQYLLSDITAAGAKPIFSASQQEVNAGYTAYGLATYTYQGKTMALVSQNSTTRVALLELLEEPAGSVGYHLRDYLDFPHDFAAGDGRWAPCSDDDADRPQFEGMVADTAHNALYLAQEDVGIWRIALNAPQAREQWQLIARAAEFGVPFQRSWDEAESEYSCTLLFDQSPGLGDEHLREDLEGLTLYDAGDGKGYLLVSSQGDNTVAVYDRSGENAYLGSFRVDDGVVDGVNETDGMMVTNIALGKAFPSGLLVMHDGNNQPRVYDDAGAERESTNFKFVDWEEIAKSLDLPLDTENRAR